MASHGSGAMTQMRAQVTPVAPENKTEALEKARLVFGVDCRAVAGNLSWPDRSLFPLHSPPRLAG